MIIPKRFALTGIVLGMAAITARAETTADLQAQVQKAQEAAAQAQEAARQAQAALQQALNAAAQARQQAAAAPAPAAATAASSGGGLTVSSGANSATLYGLIDITLVSQDHADAAGHRLTTPRVAWFSGNRWGLTGQHRASDDLSVIFRLESEFESQTGDMDTPGTLFNRDAWLGLESKALGKLTFGRQNALARDPAASAVYGDPYGPAKANLDEGGYTNNNDFKQLIFYAGSATGTRYDRGVVWKKDFGSVVAGLAYQFGEQPGKFSTNSTRTGSLAYNGSNFTIAGFLTDANIADLTHRTASIGGNVRLSPLVRLNAGYFRYTAQQGALGERRDKAWTVSTKLTPGGAFDYELGYQVMRAENAGVNGSGFVQNAYSDTSAIKAVASGDRKTAYGSIFYHLDKVTEFYAAADRLTTTGTYLAAQAHGFKSQSEVGLGMRYRF